MKRQRVERFSDVLRELLREDGLETPLAEHRAVKAWPEVAGEVVMRYTMSVELRRGKLYVRISSDCLRYELNHLRDKIRHRITYISGKHLVDDIVFQ